jgi:hypothetical protein
MANNGSKFESLALLLASGSNIKTASQKVGYSVRQGYRISASHKMKNRVSQLRASITQEAIGVLNAAAAEAAATLREMLDASHTPKDRMIAAKTILTSLAPLSEWGELRERLDELEGRLLSRSTLHDGSR